ncbi:MAG: T9SS type A sorting domain-containing protein [Flavobacteriaceae bacterium]|nr:MAG: T9SS type A sorting domain-containing protein [Flavobacteriaceae bacterium]
MKKIYFTLLSTLCFSTFSFGQIIITELADPNNNSSARYVEIYNVSTGAVDLTNWSLKRWTNGGTTVSTVVDLSSIGNLASGAFAIIASNGTTFQSVYGMTADISAGTGGPADSNGDDQIAIFNASDVMIDIFGVPGEDGSGTCHEFEDGRAERKASVTAPNTTWDESEWNVWADSTVSGCTSHTNSPRTAPGDYNPKSWIGAASGPAISAGAAVTELDYFEGNGPSTEQIFSVEGINLTGNITVTAPANFEISTTSGSGFGNTAMLTQSGGTVSSTNIYVRLAAGLSSNSYSGNVTLSSAGAADQTVALSGTVSPADPQISITAFLDNLNYIISVGGPSPEDTFSVSGLFLTNDIVITAPANFEISLTSGSGFGSSVNITPSSGTVVSTDIYVRLAAGLSAGNYNGNITVSSTGVTTQTIAVNGNAYGPPTNSMVITGIFDGPLSGGTPKGIELYVLNNIADLSLYGVSSVTNGVGSSAGNVEYNFPSGAVTAGSFIYLATESPNFTTFFGMAPTYVDDVVSINGDDSIELYESGQSIDVFGDVNTDGSGQVWDHLDGWAYRNSNTGPEGTTFTPTNWSYSGINALDGEASNSSAETPFPIGTYMATASTEDSSIGGFSVYPNPVNHKRFTITTNTNTISEKSIEIFNVLGRQVFTAKFTSNHNTVDIPSLSSGVYILKVLEGRKSVTKKLVVR